MTRAGRKPQGPALVRRLTGSPQAKLRLEVILATITGALSVEAACQKLGIEQSMLFRLRSAVLEAGLARLEPQPRGRPPRPSSPEQDRCLNLMQRIEELETELKMAAVRDELSRILPRAESAIASEKKTTPGPPPRRTRGRPPPPRSRR